MSIPLFSTAYLPPVGYVAACMHFGEVQVEVKETFPKQTYRNRALIATAEGRRALTVPLLRGNHTRTDEVRIDYRTCWNVVHLRTLRAAYAASPYYQYYADELDALLLQPYEYLIDLNQALFEWLLRKLHVPCKLNLTSDFVFPTGAADDWRSAFSPKKEFDASGYPPYYQVFADRHGFLPNLSCVDLLFNLGPDTAAYLAQVRF